MTRIAIQGAIRVLLVEDNPGDARLVREALAAAGPGRFEITHVVRLAEARRRLADERFDVLLLDLSLPDSQGLGTVDLARRAAGWVPVVVLTGLNDEGTALEALHAGVQDYLVKGRIDSDSAARALRYAIERTKRERSDVLRKTQTVHLWKSLFRTLGPGAAAVLYGAGTAAGSDCFEFIHENWSPRDEAEFLRATQDHLRSAGLCEFRDVRIDRSSSRATVRVHDNFEAAQYGPAASGPVCHFLRGILCGMFSRMLGSGELVCDEKACQAKGDEACEFVVHPMFG